MQNLGISCIAAKLVPCRLTDDQKQILADVSKELLNRANEDENLKKNNITRDEAWVYGYDVENKSSIITMGVKRPP
jgi:hypothetical protein